MSDHEGNSSESSPVIPASGHFNEAYSSQKELLPVDHGSRRAIIILRESDLRECKYNGTPEERRFLFDDEAKVLSYPLKAEAYMSQPLQNLQDADLLRPGLVLVQSPYDRDTYVELDQAVETFAIEKIQHFSMLCQLLGAEEVVVEQIQVKSDDKSKVIQVKGNASLVTAETKLADQQGEELSRKLSVNTRFGGGKPDPKAAEKYLRDHQLWNDTVMRGLVVQCAYQQNRVSDQSVTINLSNESKRTLSVVSKLNLPVSKIGISASYVGDSKSREEYSLTLSVKFSTQSDCS